MKKTEAKTHGLFGLSLSKRLAFAAAFAALCAVSTLLITIPLPFGYFNTGDVFVLLAGWCLGPLYGAIAAGIGSALADIIAGFAIYAPATFVIKALDAAVAYWLFYVFKKLIKSEKLDFLPRAISAVFGEMVMVLGYFLYELILYGAAGAVSTLLGNGLQGACCLVLATAIIAALYPIKKVKEFFPALYEQNEQK